MSIQPPGTLIQLGDRRLHLNVQGSGTPLVVLEAGIAASSVSWALVQSKIAEFTTVVSYDREGFGWSSDSTSTGTALEAVETLASLLRTTNLNGPFVLVGHSFGGLLVRVFQQRYPDLVAGLVLIDPVVRSDWQNMSPDRTRMLARGVRLSQRGALLARLGIVRAALNLLLSGSGRIPGLLARVSAGKGAGVADRLVGEVRKMPRELWPAIAGHWSEPRAFKAMADNLRNLPLSTTQLEENRSLEDLPVIVISSAKPAPEHQADARLSTRGEHVVSANSGHWVQLDDPQLVIESVRQIVTILRNGTPTEY